MKLLNLQTAGSRLCVFLTLLVTGVPNCDSLFAQSCTSTLSGLDEVWFTGTDSTGIVSYNTQTGAKRTYSRAGGLLRGEVLTDLAFAPDGKLYMTTLNRALANGEVIPGASGGALYEVTIVGAGTRYTTSKRLDFPSTHLPNSISFDADNNAYIGFFKNPEVWKRSNGSVSLWHTFPAGFAGGDFVMLEGSLYLLWAQEHNDRLDMRLFKVALGPNNTYVSHVDLGSVTAVMGSGENVAGITRLGGDLYVGGSNGTLSRINRFSPTLPELTPAFRAEVQVTGLSSKVESLGDYAHPPSMGNSIRLLACGSSSYRVDTVSVRGAIPMGGALTWHSSAPVSDANFLPVSSIKGLVEGTYFVALRNNNLNCYGPHSAITISSSSECGRGTLACTESLIMPAVVEGTPSQTVLSLTLDVSTTGRFEISLLNGSGFSLANGLNGVETAQNGVRTVRIPVNYDGSGLENLNFTISNVGSCTLNLASSSNRSIVSEVWTPADCVPKQIGPALR
nr:hypothetical protein [uncultured Dyadobacter sp.]